MSHERQHLHARSSSESTDDTDDLAPGRASRSSHLMRQADGNGVHDHAESAVATAATSTGTSLPAMIQRKFESSLGTDLSSVRVHTGAESASAAASVGARAYAVGQDIHFGAGQYDPSSVGGQHLLAHEVAHTVQQRGGTPARQNKLEVSSPHDAAEHEADRAADAMVSGQRAAITSASGLVARDKDDEDHDTKALPAEPKFVNADGSFGAMSAAIEASMTGGTAQVAMPASGFAGAQTNLDEMVHHAQASQTYYTAHNSFINNALKTVAERDASWGIGMLADARAATSATGSWIHLVNSSNSAWTDLVAAAKANFIEVTVPMVSNPLAKIDGREHAPTKGDQTINANEVGGSGMVLAGSAKQAGITDSPSTTAYKTAMREYTEERDHVTVTERRIVGVLNSAKTAAIAKKKSAAEAEKEKWETVAKAVDTFSTGVTIAIGGAGFVEGEVGELTMGDPGAKTAVVNQVGDKQVLGVADGTKPAELTAKKPAEPGAIAEKGKSVLTAAINYKIEKITQLINNYATQIQAYQDVADAQRIKADVGEYNDALGRLRTRAKNVEDQRAEMEKKLAEWARKIDVEMAKQGKAPKGSNDNAQAAALLGKIRIAATETDGAITALGPAASGGSLSTGSGSLNGLYGGLAQTARARGEAEVGRRDARYRVFGIEAARWQGAASSVAGALAALQRRAAQIKQLEAQFLATFAKNAGPTGAGSPGTNF